MFTGEVRVLHYFIGRILEFVLLECIILWRAQSEFRVIRVRQLDGDVRISEISCQEVTVPVSE